MWGYALMEEAVAQHLKRVSIEVWYLNVAIPDICTMSLLHIGH